LLGLREGLTFALACYPLRDGRPVIADGVASAPVSLADAS
jgi:hypothetical protein